MFPASYAKLNKAGSPVRPLTLTNIWVQISLIFVMFAGSTYDTLLIIASEMILVPYFLVGAYVLKLAIEQKNRGSLLAVGVGATLYGFWLLYASGLNYLLLSAILYVPGLVFFVRAKKEQGINPFEGKEKAGVGLLSVVALLAIGLLWQDVLNLSF